MRRGQDFSFQTSTRISAGDWAKKASRERMTYCVVWVQDARGGRGGEVDLSCTSRRLVKKGLFWLVKPRRNTIINLWKKIITGR